MSPRTFATVAGVLFVLVGVAGMLGLGLAPPFPDDPELAVPAQYGRLLGVFPVNLLHNLVHLLIGVVGLAAATRLGAAIRYAQGLAVLYGLLAIMGLIPALATTLGFIPLFAHDVWLHGLTALTAAAVGFSASVPVAHARIVK
jgi:hypothetical protein